MGVTQMLHNFVVFNMGIDIYVLCFNFSFYSIKEDNLMVSNSYFKIYQTFFLA